MKNPFTYLTGKENDEDPQFPRTFFPLLSPSLFPSFSFLLFPLYLDTLLMMMVSERKRFFFVTRDNKLNRETLREKKVREIEWKKIATMVRQKMEKDTILFFTSILLLQSSFLPVFFFHFFLSFFLLFLSHSFFLVTGKL